MEVTAVAIAALVVAVIALLLGLVGLVAVGRSGAGRAILGGEVERLREQLETLEDEAARLEDVTSTLAGNAGPSRQALSGFVDRLDVLADAVRDLEAEVHAVDTRADGFDARIRQLEGRLRDIASEPPPIPFGRRAGRLDDLRAVLRAQAAEATQSTAAVDGTRDTAVPGARTGAPGETADEATRAPPP